MDGSRVDPHPESFFCAIPFMNLCLNDLSTAHHWTTGMNLVVENVSIGWNDLPIDI
jgi:hypothetical protein